MQPEAAPVQSNARIASLYAQGLVDYLISRKLDLNRLRPNWSEKESPGDEAPPEVSLLEWIRLLELARAALNEPELPAKAGASLQPRHLGALGTVLMSCSDLQDAYQQLARYIRLLGQIGQPELSISRGTASLVWLWPYASPPPQSVAMFMLAARVRFMRWLTGNPDIEVQANFHGPQPGPLEPFLEIFGGQVQFGQSQSALLFPETILRLKVVSADQTFLRQAESRAQAQLRALTGEPAIIRQIKRIIVSRLASGRVGLADTAAAMHVSARTLQRHLRAENATYQSILDQVRADCAHGLIGDTSIPLAELAFLLGYRDQSTFQTAYRRWFGKSPGKDRKLQSTQRAVDEPT